MGLVQRVVTGTIKKADGTVWAGALVEFKTVFIINDGFTVPVEPVTITTDLNGAFSLSLYTFTTISQRYFVTLPSGEQYQFDLSDGVGSINLSALILTNLATLGNPSSEALALLLAGKVSTTRENWFGQDFLEVSVVKFRTAALPVGTSDFYTCPAGKKAFPYFMLFLNPTAASITRTNYFVNGVSYSRYQSSTAIALTGPTSLPTPILLEPGEKLAATLSSSGIIVQCAMYEISLTSPLKMAKKQSFDGTDELFYQVPVGKRARAVHPTIAPSYMISPGIGFTNDTGIALIFTVSYVPNGETLNANHRIGLMASMASGSQFTGGPVLPSEMSTGDRIYIKSSSIAALGTVFAWLMLAEYDV